ncbi:MAG: hypothetical protein ACPGRD_04055, partial [Planktomarina sp.]
ANFIYFSSGATQLNSNWIDALILVDVRSPINFMLGSDEDFNRKWGVNLDRGIFERIGFLEMALALLFQIFWAGGIFLPALLYRYSIKSTCWFYLPLIYLTTKLPETRMIWARAYPREVMTWVSVIMALITAVLFAFAAVQPEKLAELLAAAKLDLLPISPFGLLFVVSIPDMQPWQYFTLPSAAITLFLFRWLDKLTKWHDKGANYTNDSWQVRLAVYANRGKTICVVCWLAIALYYTLGFFLDTCSLPAWAEWIMTWHFTPPVCA